MDNVSKALIMAGGVFIAIMIVGLSMYLLGSARGIAKVSNDKVEASAIESFNRYYTTFKSPITGIDVVNIANKRKNDADYNGHDIRIVSTNITNIDSEINTLETATSDDAALRNNSLLKDEKYTFEISGYDSDGYINEIKINLK